MRSKKLVKRYLCHDNTRWAVDDIVLRLSSAEIKTGDAVIGHISGHCLSQCVDRCGVFYCIVYVPCGE